MLLLATRRAEEPKEREEREKERKTEMEWSQHGQGDETVATKKENNSLLVTRGEGTGVGSLRLTGELGGSWTFLKASLVLYGGVFVDTYVSVKLSDRWWWWRTGGSGGFEGVVANFSTFPSNYWSFLWR